MAHNEDNDAMAHRFELSTTVHSRPPQQVSGPWKPIVSKFYDYKVPEDEDEDRGDWNAELHCFTPDGLRFEAKGVLFKVHIFPDCCCNCIPGVVPKRCVIIQPTQPTDKALVASLGRELNPSRLSELECSDVLRFGFPQGLLAYVIKTKSGSLNLRHLPVSRFVGCFSDHSLSRISLKVQDNYFGRRTGTLSERGVESAEPK